MTRLSTDELGLFDDGGLVLSLGVEVVAVPGKGDAVDGDEDEDEAVETDYSKLAESQ